MIEIVNFYFKKFLVISAVDPFARNVVKKELRQNLLRRLKTEAQRDIDFSTKVIMSKKFQENLEKYLEALSKRKK